MMNLLLVTLFGVLMLKMVIQDRRMAHIEQVQERQAKRMDRLEDKKLQYALLKQRVEKMDREMKLINDIEKAKDISVDVNKVCNPIGFNISSMTIGDMVKQVEDTYKAHGIDVSYEEIILRE